VFDLGANEKRIKSM